MTSETPRRSPEELERSTKKVKANDDAGDKGRSFKDTLMGDKLTGDDSLKDSMVEDWDSDEDDANMGYGLPIPMVKVTKEMKKTLREPWKQTLRIK